MIVCLCRAVSDRAVRAAIAGGASSVEEVGRACRAGTGCGGCRPQIAELLSEAGSGACAGTACTGAPAGARENCAASFLRVASPAL
jgi:bacterioferritin-associated ferredoxin